MRGGVIVLCSGGIDSVVLAYMARDRGVLNRLLFVNYGQPVVPFEAAAALRCAQQTNCILLEMSTRIDVTAMEEGTGAPGPRVVPARNVVLLGLAVHCAARFGADEVWIGVTAEDQADYPDCRGEFLAAYSRMAQIGAGVSVSAPLFGLRRHEVVHFGERLGPLDYCWSCYEATDDGEQCGVCNSCRQGAE